MNLNKLTLSNYNYLIHFVWVWVWFDWYSVPCFIVYLLISLSEVVFASWAMNSVWLRNYWRQLSKLFLVLNTVHSPLSICYSFPFYSKTSLTFWDFMGDPVFISISALIAALLPRVVSISRWIFYLLVALKNSTIVCYLLIVSWYSLMVSFFSLIVSSFSLIVCLSLLFSELNF